MIEKAESWAEHGGGFGTMKVIKKRRGRRRGDMVLGFVNSLIP